MNLRSLKRQITQLDDKRIDELYGLEPRFEPGEQNAALGEFVEYLCPWCCENIGVSVDLTSGDRSTIEDCQVCCRPIEITLQIDECGALLGLTAQRVE